MHSIFGWGYPPGCSGPPEENDSYPEWHDELICLLEDNNMDQCKIDRIIEICMEREEEKLKQERDGEMVDPKTPSSCIEHQPKYKDGIWKEYTLMELGFWVHLFSKLAEHRTDVEKARKDLTDAQNYLDMMHEVLKAKKQEILD